VANAINIFRFKAHTVGMNRPDAPNRNESPALPEGWRLIERFDGDKAVLLDFQRGGASGPRVTGFGLTVAEAIRFAMPFMERYNDRIRGRQ
jgi:hypothetical protein